MNTAVDSTRLFKYDRAIENACFPFEESKGVQYVKRLILPAHAPVALDPFWSPM